MKIRMTLVCGAIAVTAGLPLAAQVLAPTVASAMEWGPDVTAVSPNSGPASGGTAVTITGVDLTVATGVQFGNVPARYTIVSNSEIIATSPAEQAGTVVVRVQAGPRVGLGGANFTYSLSAPRWNEAPQGLVGGWIPALAARVFTVTRRIICATNGYF